MHLGCWMYTNNQGVFYYVHSSNTPASWNWHERNSCVPPLPGIGMTEDHMYPIAIFKYFTSSQSFILIDL